MPDLLRHRLPARQMLVIMVRQMSEIRRAPARYSSSASVRSSSKPRGKWRSRKPLAPVADAKCLHHAAAALQSDNMSTRAAAVAAFPRDGLILPSMRFGLVRCPLVDSVAPTQRATI